MLNREVYAAIEIADHEVRLVVGEFFETRFNILRVERVATEGVQKKEIIDEQKVIHAIMKAVKKANETLDFKVRRVLLAIPSIQVSRYTRKVSVKMEEGSKRVRLSHVQMGLNEAIMFRPDEQLELVSVGCIKYVTNGITSRKMPLDEVCDELIMNVDLLYADKNTVYSYARCIEKAGLEILDICLDMYAMAQEAAVFEQTVDKYVVLVDLERFSTTLSLFTQGKLVNCEVLDEGYGNWLEELRDVHHLSYDVGFRLVQNTCSFIESKVNDSIVYIWSEHGVQKQLTEYDIFRMIQPKALAWIQMLNETCKPIVDSGNVHYLLSGEGLEIQAIEELLDQMNASAHAYAPQTIGARNCALVTCLGMFYSWREQQKIRKDDRICCDLNEVEIIGRKRTNRFDDEGGFTKKLKSILMSDK